MRNRKTVKKLDREFIVFLCFEFAFSYFLNENLSFFEYWTSATLVTLPLWGFYSVSRYEKNNRKDTEITIDDIINGR